MTTELRFILILMITILTSSAFAFTDRAFYGGVGYYSENFLNKVTQSANGSGSLIGETSYPLLIKYDWKMTADWFVSPTLTYTPIPRNDPGNSAKITIWHLMLPFGQNINNTWDWFVGPGLINHAVQGSGGTVSLNNGTGSAVFALPGRTSNSQEISVNFGIAETLEVHRFALDVITEGALSNKRAFSFMFSYAYMFSGGH